MTSIAVQLGSPDDMGAAIAIYERSNLRRRFSQTGRSAHDDAGALIGEWLDEGTAQL